jgi:hypothetical protein
VPRVIAVTNSARMSCVALATFVAFASAMQAQSSRERAYRIIASKKFADLTHSFGPNTPVWSGLGQAKMLPAVMPRPTSPTPFLRTVFAGLSISGAALLVPQSDRATMPEKCSKSRSKGRAMPRRISEWTEHGQVGNASRMKAWTELSRERCRFGANASRETRVGDA